MNEMIAAIGHAFQPAIFKNPNATIKNRIGSKANITITYHPFIKKYTFVLRL